MPRHCDIQDKQDIHLDKQEFSLIPVYLQFIYKLYSEIKTGRVVGNHMIDT